MTHPFQIRTYRPEDEADVVVLVRELQNFESNFYDRMSPAREIGSWYVSRVLRKARASGGDLLVAESAARIVGYASLFNHQSSETMIDEVLYTYAYVGDLIVARSARGLGIGRGLLAECEKLARAAGEKWLRITALAANSSAREIYRHCGFAEQFIDLEKPLA
jgi:GNAT superfamily N-acetyltransferase